VDKGVLYRETHSQVWNRREQGDIRRRWWCLRRAKARVRRRLSRRAGSVLGFFLGRNRALLRVDGSGLLPGTPRGGMDLRLGGRRGGFLLRGDGETVGDEVFHSHDHRDGLDLAGNAASCHFGAEISDFPEACQYLLAVQAQPAQSLYGTPGQVDLLLDELLLHCGAVLKHVGADAGFGFGVGGGVGVEADGFGGMTVGHGAREDQAGKGYFLIGDGVAHFIFGLGWLLKFETG
jgi:hypothetical protein